MRVRDGSLVDRASSGQETLDTLLSAQARRNGSKTLLSFRAERYSYADVDGLTTSLAVGFHDLGVRKGDNVCVMLPNCPEYILAWMALAKVGAVTAGLNTEYRGAALLHMIELTRARVLVVDASFAGAVEEIATQLTRLETIVYRSVSGWRPPNGLKRFASRDYEDLAVVGDVLTAGGNAPSDPMMLLFTSGSTGPSKAAAISHGYGLDIANDVATHFSYRPDDVLYTPYPLFHTDAALVTFVAALTCGGTAALAERFSASGFWGEVRSHGATVFDYLGAVMVILFNQPARADDRDNPARLAVGAPAPRMWREFEQRFGCTVAELYGATECGHPVMDPASGPERHRDGACGRVSPRFDVRVVSEADEPLPVGEVGEIVVRPRHANQHMSGYFGNPEATVRAWRNLWYHTGDYGRFDADGWLHYSGRKADRIRKRGNNMSAQEVEDLLCLHPEVLEACAIGVASDFTEQDVKALLVLRNGRDLPGDEFLEWCRAHMPRYMVPSYVEIVTELPKGPTGKVQRTEIRKRWGDG